MAVVCLSSPENLLVVANLPAERLVSWARQLPVLKGGRVSDQRGLLADAHAGNDPGGAVVALMTGAQAPLLARPFFAYGDPGPIVAALAQVPELLEATAPFLGAVLGPSAVPARTKEIVVLRTSARASCRYCVEAHTVVAPRRGPVGDRGAGAAGRTRRIHGVRQRRRSGGDRMVRRSRPRVRQKHRWSRSKPFGAGPNPRWLLNPEDPTLSLSTLAGRKTSLPAAKRTGHPDVPPRPRTAVRQDLSSETEQRIQPPFARR